MHAKTILIADDDPDLTRLLELRCRAMGLSTMVTHDASATLEAIEAMRPDAMILDVNMPGGNGLDICQAMAQTGRLADTPVIVLTGQPLPETVRRCHELCAYYVPKCAEVWGRVEPLLTEFLGLPASSHRERCPSYASIESGNRRAVTQGESPEGRRYSPHGSDLIDAVFAALAPADLPPGDSTADDEQSQFEALAESGPLPSGDATPWILCIDDDSDMARGIELRLREHGVAVRRALAGMEGYRRAFTEPAQAIVLDFEMPNGNGDYVLRRLKENPVTRDIPVIVLTGRREKSIERTMFNLGAAAFLNKPYLWTSLWSELRRYLPSPSTLPV